MTGTQTEPSITGSKAAAISNHVVRTMSEYTGRGPTKARTYINDDVVTVLLQDTLTKGERSLVGDDGGRRRRARGGRRPPRRRLSGMRPRRSGQPSKSLPRSPYA